DLEEELERAAWAALRLLGERDLGRKIGYHLERPAEQGNAARVDGHRPRLANLDLDLRNVCGIGRSRRLDTLGNAAIAWHLERQRAHGGARRPYHQQAAIRYLEGCCRLLLGSSEAVRAVGQHDRRPACIGRRRHPGIYAGLGTLG